MFGHLHVHKINKYIITCLKNIAFCFPSNMLFEHLLWVKSLLLEFVKLHHLQPPTGVQHSRTKPLATWSLIHNYHMFHVSPFHLLVFCLFEAILGGLSWKPLVVTGTSWNIFEPLSSRDVVPRLAKSEVVMLKIEHLAINFLRCAWKPGASSFAPYYGSEFLDTPAP